NPEGDRGGKGGIAENRTRGGGETAGQARSQARADDDEIDGAERSFNGDADRHGEQDQLDVYAHVSQIHDDPAANLAGHDIRRNARHIVKAHMGGERLELRKVEIAGKPLPGFEPARERTGHRIYPDQLDTAKDE